VISQSDLFKGRFYAVVRKSPWLEDLENELLAFPDRRDDRVDALIQGVANNPVEPVCAYSSLPTHRTRLPSTEESPLPSNRASASKSDTAGMFVPLVR
jgi:hypothetical protein